MNFKFFIPNAITLLSLCSGLFSIQNALNLNFRTAYLLIILCSVLDFLDGFAARKLNAKSAFGFHLDSLTDSIVFGVAPSFLVYSFLVSQGKSLYAMGAFLIAILAVIRLARFNAVSHTSLDFEGLPSPAFALWASSFLAYLAVGPIPIISGTTLLLIPLSAVLMIVPLPLYSLKNISFKGRDAIFIVLMGLFGLLSFYWLNIYAFAVIIPFYLILSLFLKLRI